MSSRRRQTDDIPGLTMALTIPFVGIAVGIIALWLSAQGLINGIWVGILSVITWIGLSFALKPLYSNLLNERSGLVSRPGCLMGLIFYAISLFVVTPILVWQLWPDWVNAGLIAVLVVPILSFTAAIIGTRAAATGKNATGRKRKGRAR
jgi:hypothetical protein